MFLRFFLSRLLIFYPFNKISIWYEKFGIVIFDGLKHFWVHVLQKGALQIVYDYNNSKFMAWKYMSIKNSGVNYIPLPVRNVYAAVYIECLSNWSIPLSTEK